MKHILLTLLLCLSAAGLQAQSMAALFTSMPNHFIPQLESAWRKDLVDLHQTGKEATLKNTMNGTSSLLALTDNYLKIQTTERSQVEIRLLPLVNLTNIICVVTTVYAPVGDSKVAFYTTEWKPLEASTMFTPTSPDWFIRDDANQHSEAYTEALSHLDMHLITYTLSPDTPTLSATYTTPQYLSKEDRDKVTPFLKDSPRVYTWERSHFN